MMGAVMSQITERIGSPELLVKANSYDSAVKIVEDELGIQYKYNKSDVSIQDYFVIGLLIDTNDMTDDFYNRIRKSTHISLLSDGLPGIMNRETALRYIAGIEKKLRKMILYVSDKIDGFELLFNIDAAVKKRIQKGIIAQDDLDPHVSYLTFGKMIQLLGFNLALNSKNTTTKDLAEMIESAKNLFELQKNLKDKLADRRVWDVIARTLLKEPIEWSVVEKDLKKLREFRNTAAHFRCITSSDNEKIKGITKRLHNKMRFARPKKLSDEEKNDLKKLFDRIYEELGPESLGDLSIPLRKMPGQRVEQNYTSFRTLLRIAGHMTKIEEDQDKT